MKLQSMIELEIWTYTWHFPFTRWICHLYFYRFIDPTLTICCSPSFSSVITSKHHTLLRAITSTFPSSGKMSLFCNLRYEKDYILNFYTFWQDIEIFFIFIIKVMHGHCENFEMYKKALRLSPLFLCFIWDTWWTLPKLYGQYVPNR